MATDETMASLAEAIKNMNKPKVPPPMAFDPMNKTMTVAQFFVAYERYAHATYENDKISWTQALRSFLVGEVLNVYSAMGATELDFDTIKTNMMKLFTSRDTMNTRRHAEFLSAVRQPNESYAVYAMRLSKLATLSLGNNPGKDELVLTKFLDSLPSDMRRQLALQLATAENPSIDKVIQMVQAVEPLALPPQAAMVGPMPQWPTNQGTTEATSSYLAPWTALTMPYSTAAACAPIEDRQQAYLTRMSQPTQQVLQLQTQRGFSSADAGQAVRPVDANPDRSSAQCFACNGYGHFRNQCPNESQNQNRFSRPQNKISNNNNYNNIKSFNNNNYSNTNKFSNNNNYKNNHQKSRDDSRSAPTYNNYPSGQNTRQEQNRVECQFCGKEGHVLAQCYKFKEQFGACVWCGSTEHKAYQCTKKQLN